MKVILMKELKGKGGEGDVIDVAQGFAVNYLLPQGIAIEATKGNLKQLEQRMHNIKKREVKRIETADDLKEALDGKTITVMAKVGEEGQLFGSITAAIIAETIQEQFGVEIDRKKIDVRKTIKTAGDHQCSIAIYRDIKADITVSVKSEEQLEAEAEAQVAAEAKEKEAAEKAEGAEGADGVEGAEEAGTTEGAEGEDVKSDTEAKPAENAESTGVEAADTASVAEAAEAVETTEAAEAAEGAEAEVKEDAEA